MKVNAWMKDTFAPFLHFILSVQMEFFTWWKANGVNLISHVDPNADLIPRVVMVTLALTLNEVVRNSWARPNYSNSVFKMFYLKCETLSAGGKEIAVWDRASKQCDCVCECAGASMCAANRKWVWRCLFYYKPLSHKIWVTLNMSVFISVLL